MIVTPKKYRGLEQYFLVYRKLLQAAKSGGEVTYQEIAGIMGLPLRGNYMARETGQMLGEISEDEHRNGRPVLSAIEVRANGGPGKGFFTLARSLGKLQSDSIEEERRFWEEEKSAVYATWQQNPEPERLEQGSEE